MSTEKTRTDDRRRVLIIANEACVGESLFETVRERGGDDSEVILAAPALSSKIRYWLSDEDQGIAQAERNVSESTERLGAAGIPVRAYVGDADPLQALDDAMRLYAPDEVIVATHPPEGTNWLEEGFAEQARARFDLPITHVEVDRESGRSDLVVNERPSRRAPARERHGTRDVVILVIAGFLAIAGTVLSLFLYSSDQPDWFVWTWVLVFDLGLKIALGVVLWILFQGRPRADRLDY